MNIAVLAGLVNIAIGVFMVVLTTKLVLRTEKNLDLVAKFFLAASITFVIATTLEINAYSGYYASDSSFAFSKIFFTITTLFFSSGGWVLYKLTDTGRGK